MTSYFKCFICGLLLAAPLAAAGQAAFPPKPFKDINERSESQSDVWFNDIPGKHKRFTVLDGVLVKSEIGIDMRYAVDPDTVPGYKKFPLWVKGVGPDNDSVWVEKETLTTYSDNGPAYNYFDFAGAKCEFVRPLLYTKKNYRLLTLDQVREKYCGGIEGIVPENVIYMINKFFVMTDVEAYRVDEDFIWRVELVNSKFFDFFKDKEQFVILRIFTKTFHNLTAMGKDDLWEWTPKKPELSW